MTGEMDDAPKVIATGGLAPLMSGVARSIHHFNPGLTLEGLRLLYERATA